MTSWVSFGNFATGGTEVVVQVQVRSGILFLASDVPKDDRLPVCQFQRPLNWIAGPSVDFVFPTSVRAIALRGGLRFEQAEANQAPSTTTSRAIALRRGGCSATASNRQFPN